jgi:hypothetical protein
MDAAMVASPSSEDVKVDGDNMQRTPKLQQQVKADCRDECFLAPPGECVLLPHDYIYSSALRKHTHSPSLDMTELGAP